MVKRYTPCHKYFDQWDEHGSPACEEARDGEYVKYKTFIDTTSQLHTQIERQKKTIKGLQAALLTANGRTTEEGAVYE